MLDNICFSVQIFYKKQSLAAPDVLGVTIFVPGTVSPVDSRLAKKELLENAN